MGSSQLLKEDLGEDSVPDGNENVGVRQPELGVQGVRSIRGGSSGMVIKIFGVEGLLTMRGRFEVVSCDSSTARSETYSFLESA
jgi:hypothetical protein